MEVKPGARFERLLVLALLPPRMESGRSRTYCKCRCDCGVEIEVRNENLSSGNSKSCGCLRVDMGGRNKTHNMSDSPEYKSWEQMINRCHNLNASRYRRYGGRGLTVCKQWRDDFSVFYRDMGPRPPNTSIERKDNSKGYYPENCVWASSITQARNRDSNRILHHQGEDLCLSEWAERKGLKINTLIERLRRGWSVSDAIETPLRGR